jgi:2-enoate reductase
METARVAALRGHKVTLCEKDNRLGGQLRYASVPPYKDELEKLNAYLIKQVTQPNIKINLGVEVTPSMVKSQNPDAVVIATGVDPIIPRIPGIDQSHVITAEAILANPQKAGHKVVVLGGGQTGCEVAAFFAENKKQVTIIEMQDKLAPEMLERQGRQELIDILVDQGVILLTQTKGEEIKPTELIISDGSGNRQAIEAETIVVACGTRSRNAIVEEIKKIVPEVYVVGDCVRPRSILDAMDEAAKIGRAL